jgi:hypothetical protein
VTAQRLLDGKKNPWCRIALQAIFKAEEMALRLGWLVLILTMELRHEARGIAVQPSWCKYSPGTKLIS